MLGGSTVVLAVLGMVQHKWFSRIRVAVFRNHEKPLQDKTPLLLVILAQTFSAAALRGDQSRAYHRDANLRPVALKPLPRHRRTRVGSKHKWEMRHDRE